MALVHLYKPNSERKICGAQGEWYLTTESRDQYYLGGYDNPVTLASGNYALKGSSTLEKYAYILATSFSRNKDLNAMSMISGTGPSGYGDMKPVRDRFEQFYRSEIQPLLDGAIGSDLRLKAYVLASHYLVLRQDYLATLKDLVHRLDREWPNEDDDETFAMGVGDKEFFLSLLDARMPSLREAAIACLPMEFLYQDRIIRKLSDTSKKVRKAAIVWLWQLSLNKNIQPPAPVPDWDEHEGCKNEDAIREYWGGQLIAGAAQASQR
jgi:hypothetical protein